MIQSKNNTHEEDGATAKYENSESHEKMYYNFFFKPKKVTSIISPKANYP